MYLVRENGVNTGKKDITVLSKSESSKDNGNMIFFPGYGGANYFLNMGFPERPTIYWVLDQFIKEDKVFIDIGAHIGSYALVCGAKANHTYAFECTPKTFCYLSANIALHELENKISPLPFALADKEGTMDLYIRGEDGGGNGLYQIEEKDTTREKVKVSVKTLDSFNIDNVGFIKIDVEGFEKKVLMGSIKTLQRSGWPPFVFECWNGDDYAKQRNELFEYITSIGYSAQKLTGSIDMWLATKK